MKKVLLVAAGLMFSSSALADTYQVTFGWTDPTVYNPDDAPAYSAKYRIAGGAETVIPASATPGGSVTVTANPGQAIEMANQACNLTLCSAWGVWTTATTGYPPTQPMQQGGMTITITRTGP